MLNNADKKKQGMKEKLLHEMTEYLINVCYLAVVFATFTEYQRLFLAAVTCIIEKQWVHALISSHLIILRINDSGINPYYLAFFLQSTAGKLQIIKNSNGGVQPEINHPSLKSILIPRLPIETQNKIAELIQQSFTLKSQSEQLLATAKHAVELAIETNEQTALGYITEATNTGI
jgi:hypothetical protein